MSEFAILCLDDQPEVLAALVRDLEPLADALDIIECTSAADADSALAELADSGQELALVISDHVMPDVTGVEWLSRLAADDAWCDASKLLLTGQASHEDTIRAINEAGIDRYLAKPWNDEELLEVARRLVTSFVLSTSADYDDLLPVLDPTMVRRHVRSQLRRAGGG
ncbi:MAG: response regulator [Planctomycetota bacterium]|jgi:two-component system chemotaxis response regulator CheY